MPITDDPERDQNLFKIIAESLGLSLNEEFAIKASRNIYKITENDFLYLDPDADPASKKFAPMEYANIMKLLRRQMILITEPFVPEKNQSFWSYNNKWGIVHFKSNAINLDLLIRAHAGLTFKTRLEALHKRKLLYFELTGSPMKTDENGNIIPPSKETADAREKDRQKRREQKQTQKTITEGKEFFIVGNPNIYKMEGHTLYVYEPDKNDQEPQFKQTDEPIPMNILSGRIKVKRFRFIPKPGDKFYSYNDDWNVTLYKVTTPDINFFCRLKLGLIFAEFKEAIDCRPYAQKMLLGKILT